MSDMLSLFTSDVNPANEWFMPEKEKKKERPRVVIDIPKEGGLELWKRARKLAFNSDISLHTWVFQAIREKLDRDDKKKR